jgi:peptide/nickel transport system substrate-binding protein
VTLVRNDGYWGPKAKLDEIDIVKAADPPRPPPPSERRPRRDVGAARSRRRGDGRPERPGQARDAARGLAVAVLGSDTTSPPFDNVKNRQALAYAIDRETILKSAYAGLGIVSPTNSLLSVNNPSYGAPVGGKLINYSYNLAKAGNSSPRAASSPARSSSGGARRRCPSSDPGPDPPGEPREDRHQARDPEQRARHLGGEVLPRREEFPGLIVPNANSGPVEAAYNFYLPGRCECNWSPPEFNTLYTKALQTADPKKRNLVWHQVQGVENREVPIWVPLQAQIASAVRSTVTGPGSRWRAAAHLECVEQRLISPATAADGCSGSSSGGWPAFSCW